MIEIKLSEIDLKLNKKKTQVYPIKRGIKFLGFRNILTDTGKVISKINPEKISQERRKLKKLKGLVDKEVMTKYEVNECYKAWKAHASKGDTHNLILKMDQYYKNLWKE